MVSRASKFCAKLPQLHYLYNQSMPPVNEPLPLANLPKTSGGALRRLLVWREAVPLKDSRLTADEASQVLSGIPRLSAEQIGQLRQLIERHWLALFHRLLRVGIPALVGVGVWLLCFFGKEGVEGVAAWVVPLMLGAVAAKGASWVMAGVLKRQADLRYLALGMLAAAECNQELCTHVVPYLEEYPECCAWRDKVLESRGLLVLDLLVIRKLGHEIWSQTADRERGERMQERGGEVLRKVLQAGNSAQKGDPHAA